jgi:hypothetical protein
VGVFIENPPYHIRPWECEHELTVGIWPIRDGKSGAGAGYKTAGKDKEQCGKDSKFSKTWKPHGWTGVLLIM